MILIALAGVGAGAINAIVGSGTLITFPTLVALGYPPVTATMSNAIGLVAGGVSGTWGYRRELRGPVAPAAVADPRLGVGCDSRLLAAAAPAGEGVPAGCAGSAGGRPGSGGDRPADPGLGAESGRGFGPLRRARHARPDGGTDRGTFAVGVYGGYFTAAQGILLIAVMGALLPEDMQRMNAAKNLLSLLVNVVAAVAYTLVAFDRISWEAAGLIAVGSLIGGFLGAHYGRRLSPDALRAVIVVVGLIGLYRLLTV